jgi:hypothetical protein
VTEGWPPGPLGGWGVRQHTRPLAHEAALVHASTAPWQAPLATHARPREAQHSWALVHVAIPQTTGAAVGVLTPPSALPVVPPPVAPPVPVDPVPLVPLVPAAPPPADVPDVPDVPPEVPAPVELEPPSMAPSSRTAPPQPTSGPTRTRDAMPNREEIRAQTFMGR